MIVITGASKGIGAFLYSELNKKGHKVIGTYNSSNSNIEGLHKLNVQNIEEIEKFKKNIVTENEKVDLINCAGITYNAFTHKSDPNEWQKVIDINLIGTYNCIRAFLPDMRSANYGRIINFSSVVAQKGTPGISAYSASKSALWGLSRSICQENASKNITINNINLGYSELGMIKQVPEAFLTALIDQIPAKKLCEPNDIMLTVEYLLNCSYINGTSIDLNGGLF